MTSGVLRKKLKAAPKQSGPNDSGAKRAWRTAFGRATRKAMEMTSDVTALTLTRTSLTEVLDELPENAMILILEGPNEGLGILALSNAMVAAMTETLTLGRCALSPAPLRKPTRTDCSMISPIMDSVLAGFEDALEEHSDLTWVSGFRFASFSEDPRALGLLLDDVPYRALNTKLSMAEGLREGEITLVLPAYGQGRTPKASSQPVEETKTLDSDFTDNLSKTLHAAPCELNAVLGRISLPIATVMSFEVGAELALPDVGVNRIQVEDLDGRRIALAKLGQAHDMRALRVRLQTANAAPSHTEAQWFEDAQSLQAAAPPAEEASPPLPATGTQG